MKNYKNMTKAELLGLVEEIERQTKNGVKRAKDASLKYSNDRTAQLPFEVGYLNGIINTVNAIINSES